MLPILQVYLKLLIPKECCIFKQLVTWVCSFSGNCHGAALGWPLQGVLGGKKSHYIFSFYFWCDFLSRKCFEVHQRAKNSSLLGSVFKHTLLWRPATDRKPFSNGRVYFQDLCTFFPSLVWWGLSSFVRLIAVPVQAAVGERMRQRPAGLLLLSMQALVPFSATEQRKQWDYKSCSYRFVSEVVPQQWASPEHYRRVKSHGGTSHHILLPCAPLLLLSLRKTVHTLLLLWSSPRWRINIFWLLPSKQSETKHSVMPRLSLPLGGGNNWISFIYSITDLGDTWETCFILHCCSSSALTETAWRQMRM